MKKPKYPTIHAEIAELNRQIEICNLPGKIKLEAQAKAEQDKFQTKNPYIQPMSSDESKFRALNGEHQQARGRRADAEREINHFTLAIERLNRMLDAEDAVSRAQKEINTLTELIKTARVAANAAQNTRDEINSMVTTEAQALDEAKAHAARAMLALVKAGKQGELPPVSRERLDQLMMAQEAAAAELVDAAETLAQCISTLDNARHDLALAQADGTARVLHLMKGDYVRALSDHKAAAEACGQYFEAPDLDAIVRQLEREAEAD